MNWTISFAVLICISTVQSQSFPEYTGLNNTLQTAVAHFNSKDYANAKMLFKYVMEKDECGCFWKSIIYLSSIYISEGKYDSSRVILDYGKNFQYFTKEKYIFLVIAYRALDQKASIDPGRFMTYRRFGYTPYTDFKITEDGLHIEPEPDISEYPEPVIGTDSLSKMIALKLENSGYQMNEKFLFGVNITIDSKGNIWYLEPKTADIPADIEKLILQAIFNATWIPAIAEKKKTGTYFRYRLTIFEQINR